MNFKKLFLLTSLLCIDQQMQSKEQPIISLKCPLLKVADNAGIFHGPMVDILKTRKYIIEHIQGEHKWSGAIMNCTIANSDKTITLYTQRPEIIYGAAFVVLAPDHELAKSIATPEYKNAVTALITKITNKSLYDRQMQATTEAIFTGSYAINPITEEQLPIYISDYAIESFDMRKSKARLGIPAHNSKDFEFAHIYNLPIKLVVDVQYHLKGQKDQLGSVVAEPLLDNNDNLTEAYLGEYSPCIVVNSDILNNLPLKDAATYVINCLKEKRIGQAHSELLQYSSNGQLYSVKDLAKIEAALYKNAAQTAQVETLKEELKIALNYIQADFLAIGEKFLINVKNTKSLMIALIEEDCEIRQNNDCYLLQWARLKGDFNEKEVFRRDITSIRNFTLFCKDLVNFLGDFTHSCPKALDNIRKQN